MQHLDRLIVSVSLQVWGVAHVNAHSDNNMGTCVALPY